MMKILMLNYEFPPLGGGAGNAAYYILKEFTRYQDLQIDLVTSSVGSYREEQFSDNIKVFFLDIGKKQKLHFQSNVNLLTYSLKSHFFSKRLLKQNDYYLCHAFFGIPCGFIAMKLNIPYIVSLRGSDVPFYNPRFLWLDRLIFKRLSGGIWRNSFNVVANSSGLKKLAHKSFSSQNIDVIYNGVDVKQFTPDNTRDETLRILCVSRLIKRKGVEYLVRSIAQMSQEALKLTIVGEGAQERSLKRLVYELDISSKVEFKEYVAHDLMNKIYQNNDILILPSLNEGMSNAVLEAMACGLPIVLTNSGGAIELIDGNGYIVAKEEPGAITQVVRRLLEDRSLITQLGRRSREISEGFSWNKVAQQYYDLYRKESKQ